MADNALNGIEILIGGSLRTGQHTSRIEDIEAFVFHRAHVEVINGDDHEHIKIVFTSVGFFIPFHRLFQRVQRVVTFMLVFRVHINSERHFAAAQGCIFVLLHVEIAGNQCEQVTGFGMRIMPAHPVTAIIKAALIFQVTVGQ